jgi:hypothetical protein
MPDELKSSLVGEVRELQEITAATDTRDYLFAAARQAERQYDDYEVIIDVDAHTQEGRFWPEILEFMENDVLKHTALTQLAGGIRTPLINLQPGMSFQSLSGRVPHQSGPAEKVTNPDKPGAAYVEIAKRSIDFMGVDYQVVFPTSMLHLGMNPMEDIEIYLARAYSRWMTELILPQEPRLAGLIYLPFNNVDECERMVREFGGHPQIVGYTICAVRHKPVHHNQYMRLYSMIDDRGKRQAAGVPRRPALGRSLVRPAQPLHLHARALIRALQSHSHDQLGHQCAARALPEAQDRVGRERRRLGSVPHAAPRP